jgi:hypothetical protein
VIASDRDVFVGIHVTHDAKAKLREEAKRRGMSMSALVAEVLDDFLVVAPSEQIEKKRSNKRRAVNPNETDVPLPLEA